VHMLTPKQAESAASGLAMRPEAKRGDMLACPACGSASISPTVRRNMGIIKRTPCPQCGTLLRLKRGRAVLATFLLILLVVGVAGYVAWPTDRQFVQSFAGPFWVLMFVVFSATLRRLPLTPG
jgi:predicted RNA-binding Zn-ribbon protein involved in translation (DUF1610 family)